MVLLPTVANEGSNAPVAGLVIPVPDHVPPGLTEDKITGEPFSQYGPFGLIVETAAGSTTKVVDAVLEQLFRVIVTV